MSLQQDDPPHSWYHPTYLASVVILIGLIALLHVIVVCWALGVFRSRRSIRQSFSACCSLAEHWIRPKQSPHITSTTHVSTKGSLKLVASKLWRPLLILWAAIAALGWLAGSAWSSIASADALLPEMTMYSTAHPGCDPTEPSTCVIRVKSNPGVAPPFATAASRHAVFGMYALAPPTALKRFIRSLRASSDADVYVATDSGLVSVYLQAVQGLRGVFLMEMTYSAATTYARTTAFATSSLRFVAYHYALTGWSLAQHYDTVMFSDMTDVIFQGDPFKPVAGQAGLHAFLEQRATTLTYPDINAQWVGQCFGNAALHSMWGAPVSCSGTTLATMDAAIEYAELQSTLARSSPWCARHGNDQGIHNYIVHTGAVQPTVMHTLEQGPIMTLDRVDHLVFDGATGALVNDDGVPYAVVHQLRRCGRFLEGGGVVQEVGSDGVRRRSTRWGCNTLESGGYQLLDSSAPK